MSIFIIVSFNDTHLTDIWLFQNRIPRSLISLDFKSVLARQTCEWVATSQSIAAWITSVWPKRHQKFLQLRVQGLPSPPVHTPMLSSVYFRSSHKNTENFRQDSSQFGSFSINTCSMLDQHLNWHSINISINTRLTLGWHLIGILINTRSTLDQQLIDSWRSVDRLVCIHQHSMAYLRKLLDHRPTEMSIKCWPRIN